MYYSLSDYNYDLPDDLIAHAPEKERDQSRLLCLDRNTGALDDGVFSDIHEKLLPSDVLVVNNTEVIPGRLYGRKETGGKVEVLILDYIGGCEKAGRTGVFECACLIRASKRPRDGSFIHFDKGLSAEVVSFEKGTFVIRFINDSDTGFDELLQQIGHMPLPPYIKRDEGDSPCDDRSVYQTVYARNKGAIAAPTAGLHFTEKLLAGLQAKGVTLAPVTLHVGYGTFLPVRVSDIRDHEIHSEWFTVSRDTADAINRAKDEGRRIVAVGTTSVRTLEYASGRDGHIKPGTGSCDLFIYPGYAFKTVDAIITNFHLPESTLLMLVSAFAGRDNIMNAYKKAVEERFRFFSYGDAMFIS